MTIRQADLLAEAISEIPEVTAVKVYDKTGDAVICYQGDRNEIITGIRDYRYDNRKVAEVVPKNTGRELNAEYKERLITHVACYAGRKLFLPAPVRTVVTLWKAVKYVIRGIRTLLKKRLEVEVLDAAAIAVSIFRGDFDTAGSVMFLLGVGEILEEWTHKKSVGDLARSMALRVEKVWMRTETGEILIPVSQVKAGDEIIVHMGNMIPLDGVVLSGEAMVNQASMTGESAAVKKSEGSYVYAGTAIEEGDIVVTVKEASGSTRYERIAAMIEESERLKSSVEGKAETLADALVPWSLGGTAITWLLTRNAAKALSILMVDFSCALKLAMPLAVLSAIREAQLHHITVKGGKFIEAVAEADTIVFDKTGTLTKAEPTVVDIVTFENWEENDALRIAACLEEHFPHSIAKAVVRESTRRGLVHEEMHSKVEYIVAHGIATALSGERAVIGSYHFVFEDEKCRIPKGEEEKFRNLQDECSHLYLAIGGRLAAILCIMDPLRDEAPEVIRLLHDEGISKIVMMTGDSERTARSIARRVGVDAYDSEVLPEDKARFVEQEKAAGRKVIMIGDGINDAPALSAADVGIAINEGAEIAREVADITISADHLYSLVTLKQLSDALMTRIHGNYCFVISFNLMLILLGVTGILQPMTTALLHNTSTIAVGLKSMTTLQPSCAE